MTPNAPAPRPHRPPAGPPRPRPTTSSSRSPRRSASTSSTRSARSAATSAPTSAPASSPSRCTRCSTRRATRSSGTSATRPTRTRSSPAAATSSPTIRQYERPRAVLLDRTSPSTTSWAPATPRPSIGYAVGLKEGMRLRGEPDAGNVVAVIGDGAMTGGVAFEAIHQAGGLGTPIVVVLNDNGMSIAPNVGALSRYFNRVRLNPKLWHAREGVEEQADRAARPASAPRFERLGPQLKESIKAFWAPGPAGGRSSTGPTSASSTATTSARCAARCATRSPPSAPSSSTSRPSRARASRPAEDGGLEGMEKWHAAKPKSIANGRPAPAKPAPATPAPPQYTTVFGEALVARGAGATARVVGITAAMNSGTGLNILQKAEPEHYFDVGIAEQQAVLFAAGLALEGAQAGRARSTRPSCSAPSTRSSTTSACRSSTSSSRWTAPASSATTARRTTACSTSPTCAACRTSSLMAPRDEAMLVAHAAHRADLRRRPDRAALPARRGRRRPAARARSRRSRSAPARSCARASAVAIVGYGTRRAARRSRRPTCSPRAAST